MKYVISCFLLVLALASCNTRQNKDSTSGSKEALVKQYFEVFNKHDWQQLASMYSETADFKDPALGSGIVKQTREQIIRKYGELTEVFPDLKDELVAMYPSGEKHMIVEFVSTGTAPDGSTFELPICTIFTIENGLITSDFTYYNNFEE